MELRDRVAIVTGSGRGVGRALALEFGRQGAKVVCCARREREIRETVDLIESEGGVGLAMRTDVTDLDAVENLAERAVSEFGGIDVLFNNAGSFAALGAVWEVDPEKWWRDVTVNLRGPMLCCRAVIPKMAAAGEGVVINMTGGNQIPGGTGYSCSKVAIERFTELLAKELREEGLPVLAFTMGPGFVRTEMTEYQIESPEGRKWLPSSRELVEQGKDRPPEDCARTTVELLRIVRPEFSGGHFGAGQDLAAVLREIEGQAE